MSTNSSTGRYLTIARAVSKVQILVFLLVPLALFLSALLGRGQIQWDARSVHATSWVYAHDAIKSGQFPHWNPFLFHGYPFAADPQTMLFYPPTTAVILFTNVTSTAIFAWIIFHFAIAGAGMYFLLKYFCKNNFMAVFGGLSYEFSGFMIGNASHLGILATAAWVPWLFLLTGRVLRRERGSWRRAVLAGLVLALVILAGHFQMALYVVFYLTLFVMALLVGQIKKSRRLVKKILLAGIILIVATLVSLPQILLTRTLAYESVRSSMSLAETQLLSLPWKVLMNLFYPTFYNWWTGYAGVGDYFYVYIGWLPIIFALLGLFWHRPQHRRAVLACGAAILVTLFYAAGSNSFLQPLFYNFVPGFNKIKAPANMMLFFYFGVIILAAIWGARLVEHWRRPRYILKASVIILQLGFLLFPAYLSNFLYAHSSASEIFPQSSAVAETVDEMANTPYFLRPRLYHLYEFAGNKGEVFKTPVADSYNPLVLQREFSYARLLKHEVETRGRRQKFLQLSGIKYFGCVDTPTQVCSTQKPLPRFTFFRSRQVEWVDDQKAARQQLKKTKLQKLLLEKTAAAMPVRGAKQPAEVKDYSLNSVRYNLTVQNDGYLLFTQTFYPGWRAWVNGEAVPIYHAQYLFMAVPIKAGDNEIIFDFNIWRSLW